MLNENEQFNNEVTTKDKELGTLARLHNSCQAMQKQIEGFVNIDFEAKAKIQAYLLLLSATAEKEIYRNNGAL